MCKICGAANNNYYSHYGLGRPATQAEAEILRDLCDTHRGEYTDFAYKHYDFEISDMSFINYMSYKLERFADHIEKGNSHIFCDARSTCGSYHRCPKLPIGIINNIPVCGLHLKNQNKKHAKPLRRIMGVNTDNEVLKFVQTIVEKRK